MKGYSIGYTDVTWVKPKNLQYYLSIIIYYGVNKDNFYVEIYSNESDWGFVKDILNIYITSREVENWQLSTLSGKNINELSEIGKLKWEPYIKITSSDFELYNSHHCIFYIGYGEGSDNSHETIEKNTYSI